MKLPTLPTPQKMTSPPPAPPEEAVAGSPRFSAGLAQWETVHWETPIFCGGKMVAVAVDEASAAASEAHAVHIVNALNASAQRRAV